MGRIGILHGRSRVSRVSIVCPVHDTDAAMLRAAAHSVLTQEGGHGVELVLVDDGSTRQGTLAALADIASMRGVRMIRTRGNRGPAAARNAGIAAATSPLIAFLDADDLWPPGSLAARLAAPAGPADIVLGGFEELLPGDARAGAHPLPLSEGGRSLGGGWYEWRAPHAARGLMDTWRHLGCLLAPKAVLRRVGGFDETLRYGEDWLLMVRLGAAARVVATNRPLYVLRRGHDSMMTHPARLTRAFSRAQEKGYADPSLRAYRKPLRWALIRQYKNMAVNSLANGATRNGVRCALRAWRYDPRDVGPLLGFLRAALMRDPVRRAVAARGYCNAVLVQTAEGRR